MHSVNHYHAGGRDVTFIEVRQENIRITFMDYGAAIVSIFVPDKDGTMESVLLAYDSLAQYIGNKRHLNATIGPTAGRIKDAAFEIAGHEYRLDKNFEDKHNLHGGKDALSYRTFDYSIMDEDGRTQVVFHTHMKRSEQNYPGNQEYRIVYTVTAGELRIEFIAETDTPTLVNLTNHAYFNLSGNLRSDILEHQMRIRASQVVALDDDMIPTGLADVADTPLDYRAMRPIKGPGFRGVDQPYVLDVVDPHVAQASLVDPVSGRRLDVYTSYPAIVCYTDNFPMPYSLLWDAPNRPHMGVCFETQYAPGGTHLETFYNPVLKPGERYYHKTVFAFTVEGQ